MPLKTVLPLIVTPLQSDENWPELDLEGGPTSE